MKKKKVLKWWVEDLLIALFLIGIGFVAADADTMGTFVISKVIAVVLMYPSMKILNKYGR